MDTFFLRLALLESVVLDAGDEFLSGSGVVDVFDADVYSLLDVFTSDALVDDDTDGGFGDVVDDTGLAVEDLEGHTIL